MLKHEHYFPEYIVSEPFFCLFVLKSPKCWGSILLDESRWERRPDKNTLLWHVLENSNSDTGLMTVQ